MAKSSTVESDVLLQDRTIGLASNLLLRRVFYVLMFKWRATARSARLIRLAEKSVGLEYLVD